MYAQGRTLPTRIRTSATAGAMRDTQLGTALGWACRKGTRSRAATSRMPRTTSIGVGYMMKNRYESRKPVTKTAAEIVTVQRRTGTRATDSERLPARTSSPMRPRAHTTADSQPPIQKQPAGMVKFLFFKQKTAYEISVRDWSSERV